MTDFIHGCIKYLMDFCFVSCVYFCQTAEAAAKESECELQTYNCLADVVSTKRVSSNKSGDSVMINSTPC